MSTLQQQAASRQSWYGTVGEHAAEPQHGSERVGSWAAMWVAEQGMPAQEVTHRVHMAVWRVRRTWHPLLQPQAVCSILWRA